MPSSGAIMTLLLPLLGATIPTTRNPAAELASLSKRDGCSLPTLGTEDIPDDPNGALCKPQGEGDWTFAMVVEETPGLPVAPGADNDFTNTQSSNAFYIFDNTCTLRSHYEVEESCNNDQGIPYTIMENFLTQVLTITSVNYDIGDPHFEFLYGNGKFSIGNNQCTCSEMSTGALSAMKGCKCRFPVDGTV